MTLQPQKLIQKKEVGLGHRAVCYFGAGLQPPGSQLGIVQFSSGGGEGEGTNNVCPVGKLRPYLRIQVTSSTNLFPNV